ncbi:MAG: T9SS type A sorting domain-containing protein [Bacteroidales bacterium]|nr:T9SS type A sorting domain-containing protein [Bacteroidales bacterium]
MKRFFTFFIAMAMFGLFANAQNYVVDLTNDTIDVTTTWSYDTVFIDASLTILDDITLTIDPGAVIMFNDFYKFKVEGTLISQGTVEDTIKYTVADTTGYYNFSHTGWDGIEFDNESGSMDDNDTSYFAYCGFYFGYNTDSDWDEGTGGAVKLRYNAYAEFSNCEFAYNSTVRWGGAIGIVFDAIAIIDSCSFYYNNSVYNGNENGGGAIAIGCNADNTYFDQAIISNCYFYRNSSLFDQTVEESRYGGGAIKISGYSDALVKNCIFLENFSTTQGGAMIISGNAQPYIVNNLFLNNTAEHNGGAVALKYYAGGYHLNNTVSGNYAGSNGGAYSIGCSNDSCFFANNIIRGNTDLDNDYDQIYIAVQDYTYDMEFYNNNIEGGLAYTEPVQVDNMNEDPLMLDPANGDFRLTCNSPCKDMSKDTLNYFPEFDLLGMPRLVGARYDLGAFETQLAVPVVLGDDLAICEGNEAMLDAGDNYETYMWSTTEGTQTIDVTIAGTYSVTVTNEYLCEASDEIEISVNGLPVVDLGENQIIDNTQSIELDAGVFAGYLWNTTETTQTISVDGVVLGIGVYDYSVIVTDVNGCEGTDEVQITIEEFVGINEINVLTAIYPNPNNGVFTVEALGNIQLIEITGRIIQNISVDGNTTIDISDYPKGIYILKISNNQEIKEYKVLVQ